MEPARIVVRREDLDFIFDFMEVGGVGFCEGKLPCLSERGNDCSSIMSDCFCDYNNFLVWLPNPFGVYWILMKRRGGNMGINSVEFRMLVSPLQ